MKYPTPWYVYVVRLSLQHPINEIQIRDADHNVLFVNAKYGMHGGAPLREQDMRDLANRVVDGVNSKNPNPK